METTVVALRTGSTLINDVTREVMGFCTGRGDGLCHVFAPHATTGLALVETGAGSERDIGEALDRLFPRDDRYTHRHGSTGHGADHVIPAFVSQSLVLTVIDGTPALGTWQSVVLVDPNFDNAERTLRLSFVPG